MIDDDYKSSNAYVNNLYKSDEYFKKNILNENSYYLYDEIKKNSLDDKLSVNISCTLDSCVNDFYNAIEAVYLDHPELISFSGINAYYYKDNVISYKNFENLPKYKRNLGAMRIERKIDKIKKDTKDLSDKDKIIYVYDYVASHNYDKMFMFDKSNQSAYSFFTKGTSVCAGFAKASQIIFQNIGIKSYLVLSSTHMWNIVEYEGKYYIFDATMGTAFKHTSTNFYDGLGKTTTGEINGLFSELYPNVEATTLREIFNI